MIRTAATLAIVDNDSFALRAMSDFLSKALPASFSTRWLTDDAQRAITKCAENPPAVLLVDMSLGSLDGIGVIREIRERDEHIGLIAVTSFPLWEYAMDAAKAGAQGIVGKSDLSGMVTLIRRVASGRAGEDYREAHFETAKASFARICHNGSQAAVLSPREAGVIELCSRGETTAAIAETLGVSEATVNTHLQRACEKLGAKNRVHLVTLWLQLSRPRH